MTTTTKKTDTKSSSAAKPDPALLEKVTKIFQGKKATQIHAEFLASRLATSIKDPARLSKYIEWLLNEPGDGQARRPPPRPTPEGFKSRRQPR